MAFAFGCDRSFLLCGRSAEISWSGFLASKPRFTFTAPGKFRLKTVCASRIPHSPGHVHLVRSARARVVRSRTGIIRCRGTCTVKFSRVVASAAGLDDEESASETAELNKVRAAVVKVLLSGGLSEDQAIQVSSEAPRFLTEIARDFTASEEEIIMLDQLHALNRINIDGSTREGSEARLHRLAARSNGWAPVLESLGVSSSCIPRISRTLSAQRLPEFLSKVEFIRDVLSAFEREGTSVDYLVRRMTKNYSLTPDEDIQKTLSYFEKLEARRGITALKDTSYAIAQLLDSFPSIFLEDLETRIKPSLILMEEYGIPREKLGQVVLCFPPLLYSDVSAHLRPRTRELKKVGVAARNYGRMILKYPWLLSKSVTQNVDEIFQFLDYSKVLKSNIDKIITKCPLLLGFNASETLAPMIEHLKTYGVKSKRLGKVFALAPQILTVSPEEFDEVVGFLKDYGYETEEVEKLLRRAPEIFAANINGTLKRKVDFLLELGIKQTRLRRIIRFYPEVLSMSVENALMPRVRYLESRGFSRKEICRMVFKFPPILGYNAESVFGPKLDFLTGVMNKSVKEVVKYPRYFSFSLEKKIKPRARVLARRQIECDLQDMLGKNNDEFATAYLGFETMYLPPFNENASS